MQADIVIDEIRAVRHKISEAFGHDIDALIKYYMDLDEQYDGPVVDLHDVPVSYEAPEPDEESGASAEKTGTHG